jgi:hypothetical protein
MGDTLDKVHSQSDRAQDIMNEAGPGTATVMWFDYRCPLILDQAMSKERALEAAPILRRFRAGLDVEVSPETKTTLIGNSYGAQVVGQALSHGVQFDRVVMTGSPGLDPSVHSAAEVTPPGTHLIVARSPGDYVSYAEVHGPDPASFPDAFRLEINDGRVEVRGHMNYFRVNSESMRNIGRIIRGDLAAVTRTNTTPRRRPNCCRAFPGPARSATWPRAARSRRSPRCSTVCRRSAPLAPRCRVRVRVVMGPEPGATVEGARTDRKDPLDDVDRGPRFPAVGVARRGRGRRTRAGGRGHS